MRLELPYAVCLLAGVLLRVVDIGARPLSSAEAVASWTAWTRASSLPMPALAGSLPDSALLHAMQSAVFWIGGTGDAAARLPVAIVGAVPILLVWLLRDALGRPASIALAALIAVDPLAVGWSRMADGAALSHAGGWAVLLCAAATATPGINDQRRIACAYGLPTAAGCLLVSGHLAWLLLPPLALVVALLMLPMPLWPERRPSAGTALSILVATVVLAGSAGLTQWDGLQFVSSAAAAAVQSWTIGPVTAFRDLWMTIVQLERLPLSIGCLGLALGALAIGRGSSRGLDVPIFSRRVFAGMVIWVLWAAFLTAAPGRSLALWLVAQPPLLLGAAWLISSAAAWLSRARRADEHGWQAGLGWTAVGLLAVDLTGSAVKVTRDRQALLFRPYDDVTEPAVRRLAEDIEGLLGHGESRLQVVSRSGADPVLGWALRSQPGVAWVAAPEPAGGGASYILADGTVPAGGSLASTYPLRARAGARKHVTVERNAGVQ